MNMSSQNPILSYSLSSKISYLLGEPIIIGYSLINHTNEPMWILKWYTPFEGIKGKIFTINCDNREIQYEGPMVKRGDPVVNDYMFLEPRGERSTQVDLSQVYNLPISSRCRVRFRGRLYDVIYDSTHLPRKRGEHRGIDIQGNEVIFSIKK